MGIIYCARNKVNGKRYIGKSEVSMLSRRIRHEYHKNCSAIAVAIRKYGVENFEWTVIFEDVSDDQLDLFEIDAIAVYNTLSPNGYNLTVGGEGGHPTGYCSEETRRKISEGNKGKKRSDETKKKMSVAAKSKPPISEETRQKISEAHRNRSQISEETRQRMSRAHKGKKVFHTEETCCKISRAHKGKKHSPETLQKMREAHKRRRELNSAG